MTVLGFLPRHGFVQQPVAAPVPAQAPQPAGWTQQVPAAPLAEHAAASRHFGQHLQPLAHSSQHAAARAVPWQHGASSHFGHFEAAPVQFGRHVPAASLAQLAAVALHFEQHLQPAAHSGQQVASAADDEQHADFSSASPCR
jgi:hypothetical protein